MARAQVSIEFFLAFLFFILALYWLSNEAGFAALAGGRTALNGQARASAEDLAFLSNAACSRGQALTIQLPALTDGRSVVGCSAVFSGYNVTVYSLSSPQALASARALCPFASTTLACGGSLCVNASNSSSVKVTEGGCA